MTVEKSAEALELTERELAIAQGLDPDAITQEVVQEEVVDQEGEVEQDAQEDSTVVADEESPSDTDVASPSWLADYHRNLGASYGLTEDDLKSFGTEAEFNRATRLLDRQLLQPARTVQQQRQQEQEQAKPSLDPAKYREAGYDEDTVKLVEELAKTQEELAAQRAFIQQQQMAAEAGRRQQQVNYFHQLVDGFADERLGKSVDGGEFKQLTKEQNEYRRQIWETAETLIAGMQARAHAQGVQPQIPPAPIVLERARMQVLGSQIVEDAKKASSDKIVEQSRKRRPVAGQRTRATSQVVDTKDPIKRIANDPKVIELWKSFQEANGTE